jgi:hypothetical protein
MCSMYCTQSWTLEESGVDHLRGYIYNRVLGQYDFCLQLAGEDMIFQWIGIEIEEYIPCYNAPTVHWYLLPATRLGSSKIFIEQNIKRRTGPALYVFSLLAYRTLVYTVYTPQSPVFILSAATVPVTQQPVSINWFS